MKLLPMKLDRPTEERLADQIWRICKAINQLVPDHANFSFARGHVEVTLWDYSKVVPFTVYRRSSITGIQGTYKTLRLQRMVIELTDILNGIKAKAA